MAMTKAKETQILRDILALWQELPERTTADLMVLDHLRLRLWALEAVQGGSPIDRAFLDLMLGPKDDPRVDYADGIDGIFG